MASHSLSSYKVLVKLAYFLRQNKFLFLQNYKPLQIYQTRVSLRFDSKLETIQNML